MHNIHCFSQAHVYISSLNIIFAPVFIYQVHGDADMVVSYEWGQMAHRLLRGLVSEAKPHFITVEVSWCLSLSPRHCFRRHCSVTVSITGKVWSKLDNCIYLVFPKMHARFI